MNHVLSCSLSLPLLVVGVNKDNCRRSILWTRVHVREGTLQVWCVTTILA